MRNRREFLLGMGAGLFGAGFSSHLGRSTLRPNILIVITDEQSADAASYRIGKEYINTPNLDRLAARSKIYTEAYCANPLCVPSRTSMFTGQYPTTTGVMDNDAISEMQLDVRRFPILGNLFQDAGYETAFFGKWHLPVAIENHVLHGFETTETKMVDSETAAHAAGFIRQEHKAPFLVVASFLNPHNICEWARGQRLPLGAIGQPPPVKSCPPIRANHGAQKGEPDIMTLMRRSYQKAPMFPVGDYDVPKWREYEWAYYRLVEKVDSQIGIVLQALYNSGQEKETLVVMLSDHGDCQGAHGWNQKTVLYEEAARVPLLLSWPGVIDRGISTRLVNTGIDLLPTLLDYAGLHVPPNLPGLSVNDRASKPPRYVVVSNRMIQGAPVDGRRPVATGRMIRGLRYKYCAYSEGIQRESLVDLRSDPGEMFNLAIDPGYQHVLVENRLALTKWCRETKDSFIVPS